MTHGHEVLEMMFGNSYSSREDLVNAIINKFGADERFYTCSAENMTALRLTGQRCAIIESKSMKERKETINIATANIVSIGILVVSALVLYGIFFLIWDYQDWFYKEKLIEVMDQFGTNYLMFMGALIVGIVVHELIHGLTWAKFAKSDLKSISFGVMWKMLTPYCHCSEPLKVSHYSIGALMPLIVLGILPSIAAICLKSLFWLTMGVIFIAAAAGDIMVVWRLRKENPENMVLDHPSEAGYLVYEEEPEDL